MSQVATILNEPLSPHRIGGIAAAMAIHVAAFMMLMAPMSYMPPPEAYSPDITFFDVLPPPPIPLPPPPNTRVITPVVNRAVTPPAIATPTVTPQLVTADPGINDLPYTEPVIDLAGPPISLPSGPISLSTEYAPPPRYPPLSLRNGEQGRVMLLVQVGADGLPIGATIHKSSGYRDLDKSALKHVLATWRFHPAMHQGVAIPALALVPVDYKIAQ